MCVSNLPHRAPSRVRVRNKKGLKGLGAGAENTRMKQAAAAANERVLYVPIIYV